MSNVDLHMHSTASDGTDTPEELLKNIRQNGITTFAVTDHDTIEGAMQMEKLAHDGVTFIRGIEFSSKAPSGKCHIVGFDYDPQNEDFVKAIEMGRSLRKEKFEARLSFLQNEIKVPFTEEELAELRRMTSVGKPHLANIMIKKGFAVDKKDAIENYIDKCPTKNTRIPAEIAVKAILSAGGIPVWAHPLGGDGNRPKPEEQFKAMLEELTGYGMLGMECYYSTYTMPQTEWLTVKAHEKNLLISGGSDYHGRNKAIPLGKLNQDNEGIPAEKLTVLRSILERRA